MSKYTVEVSVISGDLCGIQSCFTLKGDEWDNLIDNLPSLEKDYLLEALYETAEFQDAESEVKSSALEEIDEDDDRDDSDMSVYEEITIINNETNQSFELR